MALRASLDLPPHGPSMVRRGWDAKPRPGGTDVTARYLPLAPSFRADDLIDPASGCFRRWYFSLRLEEEIARALDAKRPASLVAIRLQGPAVPPGFMRLVSRSTGQTLLAGQLSDGDDEEDGPELALFLPYADRERAGVVSRRLRSMLARFSPVVAVVSSPEQGASAEALLSNARALLRIRSDRVVWLAAYQALRARFRWRVGLRLG